MSSAPRSLRALLSHVVDYAGLFPPAGLNMATTVNNFARYRGGPNAWMLGRLIVPVTRLDEFETAAAGLLAVEGQDPWRLSALCGGDLVSDTSAVFEFNHRCQSAGVVVDAIEFKAEGAPWKQRWVPPAVMPAYGEIPVDGDPGPRIQELAGSRIRAKIRTGGVTADAFPSVEQVARFILSCYAKGVAFKATAGLHHPVRCARPLTYERGAPVGTMHGFLNVFVTAALCYNGLRIKDAHALLGMDSIDEIEIGDGGIAWREYTVTVEEIETVRRRLAISFGSCSFTEPVADLSALNLI